MKCIICGKELTGQKIRYCSMRCAKIACKNGLSKSQVNTEKKVKELWEKFKKTFDVTDKITAKNAWKMRVFISACYKLEYSPSSIARGLSKNHSSIIHHFKKASEQEKQIAYNFLDDKEYIVQTNYPKNFHY